MRTPERRLEIVSFRAKPSANPVNPRPATSADTLTPKVPSAVTNPNKMSVILLVRANSEVRLLSNFNRPAALVIILFIIFARIKKATKIITTPVTLGTQRVASSSNVCTRFSTDYESLVIA